IREFPDQQQSAVARDRSAELRHKNSDQPKPVVATGIPDFIGDQFLGGPPAITLSPSRPPIVNQYKRQAQDTRTEAAVRRVISELWRGRPDYSQMVRALADLTRTQLLPQFQSAAKQLGELKSVTFIGVGPSASDVYDVQFANGGARFSLMLTPDG